MDICILEEGKLLGVDDLEIKGFLVGYPDGGIVEDLPWEEHGLWWFSGGHIA